MTWSERLKVQAWLPWQQLMHQESSKANGLPQQQLLMKQGCPEAFDSWSCTMPRWKLRKGPRTAQAEADGEQHLVTATRPMLLASPPRDTERHTTQRCQSQAALLALGSVLDLQACT